LKLPRSKTNESASVIPPPPFVGQEETWDCGIACLQMVLLWLQQQQQQRISPSAASRAIAITTASQLRQSLLRDVGTQSVWTADLMRLLDQYITTTSSSAPTQPGARNDDDDEHDNHAVARYLFCSTCLQVNPELQSYDYYCQAFARDQQRVKGILEEFLLRQQRHDGLRYGRLVQHDNLTLDQVVRLVQLPCCVAIALVDNSILVPTSYTSVTTVNTTTNHSPSPHQQQQQQPHFQSCRLQAYVGHFILLVGVSRDPQHLQQASAARRGGDHQNNNDLEEEEYCFLIYNPASGHDTQQQQQQQQQQQAPTCLSARLFEQAWSASGTDKDILFVVAGCGGGGAGT